MCKVPEGKEMIKLGEAFARLFKFRFSTLFANTLTESVRILLASKAGKAR